MLALGFLISACALPLNPTLTSVPSPTEECEKVVNSELTGPPAIQYLIVTLVDNTNLNLNSSVMEDYKEVVLNAIEPGDKFYLFALGKTNFESSLIYTDSIDPIHDIQIHPSPTLIQTLIPISTAIPTRETSLGQIAAATGFAATQETYLAVQTQIANSNNCALLLWQQDVMQNLINYNNKRDIEINEFHISYSAAINTYRNLNQLSAENTIGGINSGFENAALVFENECKEYDRCLLILLLGNPINDGILTEDLENIPALNDVSVATVLTNCRVIFAPECNSTVQFWKNSFTKLGVFEYRFFSMPDLDRILAYHLVR